MDDIWFEIDDLPPEIARVVPGAMLWSAAALGGAPPRRAAAPHLAGGALEAMAKAWLRAKIFR